VAVLPIAHRLGSDPDAVGDIRLAKTQIRPPLPEVLPERFGLFWISLLLGFPRT